jgi:hypothetical protein
MLHVMSPWPHICNIHVVLQANGAGAACNVAAGFA